MFLKHGHGKKKKERGVTLSSENEPGSYKKHRALLGAEKEKTQKRISERVDGYCSWTRVLLSGMV